jgi:MscS family membrane protein
MNSPQWLDHLQESFNNGNFLGIAVPDLAKFGGFLVGGFILGKLLRYPLAAWIERITPKEDHTTSQRVAASFEKSTFLLIFAVVLNMGAIDVLKLPGWLWDRLRLLPVILLSMACTMLVLQVIDVALLSLRKRWYDRESQVDDLLINFIRKGSRIFVIILAILITAQKMDFPVTSAITGLGIGGAALALGAQGLIANIIGTIEIVAGRLYHVGDRIHFDQYDGFVTDVGLRSTKIRALTGEQIIVPNKKMAETQLRNFSKNGLVRTNVTMGITYSSNHDQIRRAMQILDDIFKARKDVDSHQIYLKNLGDYSLELEVIFWARYDKSNEYNEIIGQLHLEIKRLFDDAHIEFAFPTQTLHIAGGEVPFPKK